MTGTLNSSFKCHLKVLPLERASNKWGSPWCVQKRVKLYFAPTCNPMFHGPPPTVSHLGGLFADRERRHATLGGGTPRFGTGVAEKNALYSDPFHLANKHGVRFV